MKTRRQVFAESAERNRIADATPEFCTANRLVTDQNGKTGRAFSLGKYPARHNACEAIALHNAKVLTGRESKLSDAIEAVVRGRAVPMKGFFGTLPWKLGRVLANEGVPFEKVRFRECVSDGVYILSFWNKKPWKNGLHTVAATRNGGTFTLYNWSGTTVRNDEAFRKMKRRFVCGHKIVS